MAGIDLTRLTLNEQDARSESSQPLLNFLFQSSPDSLGEELTQNLHSVTAGIGVDKNTIPDESEQDRNELLLLIKDGIPKAENKPSVTIIGAGTSGLCAGYELKKANYNVTILEASSRVGGRVKTFRDPSFAPGLHGEGGAMRIPKNHYLLHQYIDDFGLKPQLFSFEMENKFIYISGFPETLTYERFNQLLIEAEDPARQSPESKQLLDLFPDLRPEEKGKTCDRLFSEAVLPVVEVFKAAYKAPIAEGSESKAKSQRIIRAYKAITDEFDKYTLRSYLTDYARWSKDAINLYNLGNAHVVLENGFIESFKDAFLSSNDQGRQAGMEQLQSGMDAVPNAFISPERGTNSLIDNIIFGARARHIGIVNDEQVSPYQRKIEVEYETPTGHRQTIVSDYLILAIPYTSQRTITKSHPFAHKQEMAIREVRYVEVTKVLLQYKKRWWNDVFQRHGQGLDGGLVCDLPIRYTMFPKTEGNEQFKHSARGVIMAAYTFEQDATILSALSPERRIQIAAENLDRIFPEARSLDLLEAGASQCFPADELAGGSAFCYFGPTQKTDLLPTMFATDWSDRVFFAGEQASFSHGWIQGAFEAGLRCVKQVSNAAQNRPQ